MHFEQENTFLQNKISERLTFFKTAPEGNAL